MKDWSEGTCPLHTSRPSATVAAIALRGRRLDGYPAIFTIDIESSFATSNHHIHVANG